MLDLTCFINLGVSSLSEREYVAVVIAHELAHQWFGDLGNINNGMGLFQLLWHGFVSVTMEWFVSVPIEWFCFGNYGMVLFQ